MNKSTTYSFGIVFPFYRSSKAFVFLAFGVLTEQTQSWELASNNPTSKNFESFHSMSPGALEYKIIIKLNSNCRFAFREKVILCSELVFFRIGFLSAQLILIMWFKIAVCAIFLDFLSRSFSDCVVLINFRISYYYSCHG